MITLSSFIQPDPAREESVSFGPNPIRNWKLAISTAIECGQKYGHALLWSNGTEDKPATLWQVRRALN